MTLIRVTLIVNLLFCMAGCAGAQLHQPPLSTVAAESFLSNNELVEKVRGLNPEHVSAEEVSSILSKCPAPRLLAFNGSAFDTMSPFAKFLRNMGYPRVEVRSSYGSGPKVAREVEETFRNERMKPILIGHSQGGAFVVKVLHSLRARDVSFAAAIASGKWMRVLLGQWDMLPLLRKVPATAEEFTGYRLAGDFLDSDVPLLKESGDYEAAGEVEVRNILLRGPGHLDVTRLDGFAEDPETRRQLEDWTPSAPLPKDAKLWFAADIWYHVKKHWCLQLQGLIDGSQNNL